jgi:predicted N-acyltransferase
VTKPKIIAKIAGAASEIGREAWNACANGISGPVGSDDPHPFTRYEFFAACEESKSATARTGWRPAHLVIENDGAITGLMPMYLKSHSQGEYVFDYGWADAFERAGGAYYPKLQASVPFTPVTGHRLLVAAGAPLEETRNALLAAGAAAVNELEASSLHITFMTEREWKDAGALGFLQRTDQQFHWRKRSTLLARSATPHPQYAR